ncbi:MAG: arsenate reductase family protein [Chlorobiaceae bacterium]|jgi:arsenate reductase (glutaredoxin)|nr:arsenate reductase family protein [Chlorobiaceae bacterium]NTV16002.1 arsenate reductase family protein [Chlorobiaceae bacterium]
MAIILFYEKPGCMNNARQKSMLELSGHTVEAINLLEYPWTNKELDKYLGEKPVAECFNPAAPAVKSGKLDTLAFTKEEAIAIMIHEPLLIRRPLIKIGNHHLQGFDTTALRKIISLNSDKGTEDAGITININDINSCPHNNTFSCIKQED